MPNTGPHLKEWRKHRGLTLEVVSDRIGLAPSTLSRIERGEIAYTRPNIEAMAVIYRCRPVDLFATPDSKTAKLAGELGPVIESLTPEQQEQAARVLRAMFPKAA